MVVFAVVVAVIGVILVLAGAVLFANGIGVNPEGRTEPERVMQGFAQVPYREMFGLMPRSVKLVTDGDASRRDRVKASGAFIALAGIVALFLAALALIGALL